MSPVALPPSSNRPLMPVLAALSVAHLLNDLIQSMIPAIYPLIKDDLSARFRADRPDHARLPGHLLAAPAALGIPHRSPALALCDGGGHGRDAARASSACPSRSATGWCWSSAALVGLGSAVFHPEATRMARHAAAGRQGLAQGVFQIGGHAGYAIGPLLAAAVVVPRGQASLSWFSGVALVADGADVLDRRALRRALRREQACRRGVREAVGTARCRPAASRSRWRS